MALSGLQSSITVCRDEQNSFATLNLCRGPVNALSFQTMRDILAELDRLEGQGCRGVIISSTLPGVFCGGLELANMMVRDRSKHEEFIKLFQKFFMRLYSTKMITIAAVNGNAHCGGCVLAMACDYRIMTDHEKASIGLSETRIGFMVSFWIADAMANLVGSRETERAILQGKLYTPEEALKVSLVDKLCGPSDLKQGAEEEMKRWLALPAKAFQRNKKMLRKPAIDEMKEGRDDDIQEYVEFMLKDETQAILLKIVSTLKEYAHKPESTPDQILGALQINDDIYYQQTQ